MLYPPLLKGIYEKAEAFCRDKGLIAGKSGKHMVFPYTISAKIAQFPFFYYCKNNWIWMYYPVGWLVGFYLFGKCHQLANSESNKKSWAEQQRKAAEKEHHH